MTPNLPYKHLADALIDHSGVSKRGITFIREDGDAFLSFRDLYLAACGIRQSLKNSAVPEKAEIILQLTDNQWFVSVFWGCILGGYIPIPVQTAATPESRRKLQNIWKQLRNPFLITGKKTHQNQDPLPLHNLESQIIFIEDLSSGSKTRDSGPCNVNPVAFIQYSSGSCGDPKGVVLTHDNIMANAGALIERVNLTKHDRTLSWMPLVHDMGLIGFHIVPMLVGASHSILPTSLFIRRPHLWLEKAAHYHSTIINGTTSSLNYFLKFFKGGSAASLDLSRIRLVFIGAEPVSAKICRSFSSAMSPFGLSKKAIFPVYGLAEATLAVTVPPPGEGMRTLTLHRSSILIYSRIKIISPEDNNGIPVVELGYPMKGIQMRIVDDENRRLPSGTIGQIQVRGDSITGGYHRNPIETEKIIHPDGWLDTGDLGFFHQNRLIITDRKKDIILKGGQNFFPHDLESIIMETGAVQPGSAVIAGIFNHDLQEDTLIGFIRAKGTTCEPFYHQAEEISSYLLERTGLALTKVYGIKRIPKTSSGKIRRFMLRQKYSSGSFDREDIPVYSPPVETPVIPSDEKNDDRGITKHITGLFREILAAKNVNPRSNFFRLGGDSLQAMALLSRIGDKYRRTVSITAFFRFPTPNGLAKQILQSDDPALVPETDKTSIPISDVPVPLTMKRIYFLSMFKRDTIAYNIPFVLKLEGNVSTEDIRHSIETIISRHENLRCSFILKEGEVTIRIRDRVPFKLEQKKIRDDQVTQAIQDFIRPFRLDRPPLFRIGLFESPGNHHYLAMDFHHLIMDGYSLGLFLEEFFMLYRKKQPVMAPPPFSDYLNWRQNKILPAELNRQKTFWTEKLKSLPSRLELPLDHPRKKIRDFEGDSINFSLNHRTYAQIGAIARSENSTAFSVFLTAYTLFLHRITGEKKPVFGIPIMARPPQQFDRTMGMFVNIIPFSACLDASMTIGSLLSRVSREMAECQRYPYYQFSEFLDRREDMSRNPLFDTLLVYHNWNRQPDPPEDIKVRFYPITSRTSKFDLSLNILPAEEKVFLNMEYRTGIFKKSTVKKHIDTFLNILHGIIKDPDKNIRELLVKSAK